jgi:hypothetical protein
MDCVGDDRLSTDDYDYDYDDDDWGSEDGKMYSGDEDWWPFDGMGGMNGPIQRPETKILSVMYRLV